MKLHNKKLLSWANMPCKINIEKIALARSVR